MYLIQGVSGHTTEQILSYFYSIANGVAESYMQKKKLARRVNKILEWHYEGFDIVPYKMNVFSDWGVSNLNAVTLSVEVTFPRKFSYVDVTEMLNSIVENSIGLDGAEPWPAFEKPRTRVPVGFKKTIHK
jgi:hypothetical protein